MAGGATGTAPHGVAAITHEVFRGKAPEASRRREPFGSFQGTGGSGFEGEVVACR